MNFYPKIKGYYIKDGDNSYYILLSLEKYNSDEYTGLKLLKFVQPHFSFPSQSNFIK